MTNDFSDTVDLFTHGHRRNIGSGFGNALDQAVVLLREEALGNAHVQHCGRQ